jgi:hypothetical protein
MNERPASLKEFEEQYRKDYEREIKSCEGWQKFCEEYADGYGKQYYEGRFSALIYFDLQMCTLLRVLKHLNHE